LLALGACEFSSHRLRSGLVDFMTRRLAIAGYIHPSQAGSASDRIYIL